MTGKGLRQIIRTYYEAWAARDREAARASLTDDLVFVSAEDRFSSADAFLAKCWTYSEGLQRVEFVRDVCDEDQAFVIVRWHVDDGSSFVGAEWLRVDGGKIAEVLVVRSDVAFGELLSQGA